MLAPVGMAMALIVTAASIYSFSPRHVPPLQETRIPVDRMQLTAVAGLQIAPDRVAHAVQAIRGADDGDAAGGKQGIEVAYAHGKGRLDEGRALLCCNASFDLIMPESACQRLTKIKRRLTCCQIDTGLSWPGQLLCRPAVAAPQSAVGLSASPA